MPRKKWSGHHGQQKSQKCSTWMQSQKRQNGLCSFPRQTSQYHNNPSLCLGRNGVAIMVNKRVRNAVLGCNLKNDRMVSVRFQGKPVNITIIQVYASEEMEWPSWSTKESEMQYLDAISKTTEWSLFVSKANQSISQ